MLNPLLKPALGAAAGMGGMGMGGMGMGMGGMGERLRWPGPGPLRCAAALLVRSALRCLSTGAAGRWPTGCERPTPPARQPA
jgi:hypothetical protein